MLSLLEGRHSARHSCVSKIYAVDCLCTENVHEQGTVKFEEHVLQAQMRIRDQSIDLGYTLAHESPGNIP